MARISRSLKKRMLRLLDTYEAQGRISPKRMISRAYQKLRRSGGAYSQLHTLELEALCVAGPDPVPAGCFDSEDGNWRGLDWLFESYGFRPSTLREGKPDSHQDQEVWEEWTDRWCFWQTTFLRLGEHLEKKDHRCRHFDDYRWGWEDGRWYGDDGDFSLHPPEEDREKLPEAAWTAFERFFKDQADREAASAEEPPLTAEEWAEMEAAHLAALEGA